MKHKKVTDFPKNKENPFVENAVKEIKSVKKTQVIRSMDRNDIQLIKDTETGELNGHTAFMRFIEVDEEQFAKIYLSQFVAFWELSKPAIRVFGYILKELKPNKDKFVFRMDQAMEETKYTHRKDILAGLASLIESGIIARTHYDWEYFINPLIIFNGSRVTFAKTFIKKKKQVAENQTNLFKDLEVNQEKKIAAFENEFGTEKIQDNSESGK